MSKEGFEKLVEFICTKGCIEVNQIIVLLEKEEVLSDLDCLSYFECQLLLKELKSIMNVYDGKACSL